MAYKVGDKVWAKNGDGIDMDDKVVIVNPKDCDEIDLDATQMAYLFGARTVLSIEQDLKLAEQGVKTRKPVQYGKKVVVGNERRI